MKTPSGIVSLVILLLIVTACFAGCSEETPASATETPAATVTPAVPATPHTTAATIATTRTTVVTTVPTTVPATTTIATTTTTAASPPKVTEITPDKGTPGTSVPVTALVGRNFLSGANVTLKKTGETPIAATNVVVSSSSLITCTFVLPSDTDTGYWGVVVKNPDNQYYEFQNGFYVIEGDAVTATATATATATPVPSGFVKMTSLLDTQIYTGGNEKFTTIGFIGTNLSYAKNLKLTKGSSTITGSSFTINDNNLQGEAGLTIPPVSTGIWTVSLVDSSGNVLASLANSYTID